MRESRRISIRIRALVAGLLAAFAVCAAGAQALVFTKVQVAERIRKVENGVDEFRDYLERRGDDARDRAESTKDRARHEPTTKNEARKERAKQTKDDLEDALGELNQSTNRLRRKFDPSSNYLETRVQMERVMDDARRVNQVMVRGSYGTQPERYWAVLRANINDLARCYGLAPLGV